MAQFDTRHTPKPGRISTPTASALTTRITVTAGGSPRSSKPGKKDSRPSPDKKVPPSDKPSASDRQEGGDHYKRMNIQPWDVVDTWPLEQRIGAYRSGALKYIMRMGSKDQSAQEIAKGKHYLEKLLEILNLEDV